MHVAVGAVGDKLREAEFCFAERVGSRDAGNVEAVRACEIADGGLERGRVGQKSRSA